jgi:3-hydroxyisobutyrate dehydrogenase-like beta-hydroxyacid dehydrogenase
VLESVVAEILTSGSLVEKIIVDTSTVHPDSSVTAASKLKEAGAVFIAGRLSFNRRSYMN